MAASNFEKWLENRIRQRAAKLTSRLSSISGVRDAPAPDDILIGSAVETRAVILFADVVGSTKLAIKYAAAPEKMLTTLNLLIPTLQDVVYHHRGQVEKNTGDGLLAYFGVGTGTSDQDAAHIGLWAAARMMQATSTLVNQLLAERGLKGVQITIGADLGDVLIARIGIQRQENPLVAVGEVASRAAKIQESALPGEIRIGESLYRPIASEYRKLFREASPPGGWPFSVPKSEAVLSWERMQAEREAREAQDAARDAEGLSWLSLHVPYTPLPPLTFPRFVDPTRPYRIYALRRRWP